MNNWEQGTKDTNCGDETGDKREMSICVQRNQDDN